MDEERLIVALNPTLIRQAFQNLLTNCISYSNNPKAQIKLDCSSSEELKIHIINSGIPLTEAEQQQVFNHIFRGINSQDKTGFGLGLVLVKKTMDYHQAAVAYSNPTYHQNVVELRFPLS